MKRWRALDRLRALAVVLMVQGHTFTTLLRDGELSGGFGRLHTLIHGLTAPTFLFGAGLAFGVTTYARYPQHHQGGQALRDRLRRYAWLIAVGYALQLPGGSLWSALSMKHQALGMLFQVGPLHLIAATLLICQLAALLFRTARQHALTCLGLALLVLSCTPSLWKSAASTQLGPVLGPWIDNRTGSQFPAFPWSAFALLGVAFAGLLQRFPVLPRGRSLFAVGCVLAGSSYLAFALQIVGFEPHWFWCTNPVYVVFRLGLVLALLAALSAGSAPWLEKLTGTLSRQSLVAYVAHLLILYGTPWTPNLVEQLGGSLGSGEACLAFAIVFSLTVLVAQAWEWLSRECLRAFRWVQAGLTVLCMLALAR